MAETKQKGYPATGPPPPSRKCSETTRYGRPCPMWATVGKSVCWHHDPENADQRKHNATVSGRAAHSPVTREIQELKDEIKDLIREVKEGTVAPNIASVITQLANTLIRGIDIDRRVKVEEDLEERLARLEGEAGEEK